MATVIMSFHVFMSFVWSVEFYSLHKYYHILRTKFSVLKKKLISFTTILLKIFFNRKCKRGIENYETVVHSE